MKSTLIGFDTTTNCMHIVVVTSTQVHLGLGALGILPYYTKRIVHRLHSGIKHDIFIVVYFA